MRKLLFLFLLIIPSALYCKEPNIILSEEACDLNDYRNEAGRTTFTAELLSNGFIKVLSSDVTTFTVKICNASTGAVFYQGSTDRGVLHITTATLTLGRYELQIFTEGICYYGTFNINQ